MALSLDIIAAHLEGLEETIISKLIDRAQFSTNQAIYEPGKSGFSGESELSLFELRLRAQEKMDAQFGRFCVPEERPFTDNLEAPFRKVSLPDLGLRLNDYNEVNLTPEIQSSYFSLLPTLCSNSDDGNYGSSVEHDVMALQAISRRIHFGSFYVAEAKFLQEPGEYQKLIEEGNYQAILEKLTRREVEEKIYDRVKEKVSAAQARINTKVRTGIDPELVLQFYRDTVIPLTKKGEVAYMQLRKES